MKILIVEDDPFVAEDLKSKLEKWNYQITGIAESYEVALDSIDKERPDLVFLDIELKGEKTGIDLSKKLVQQGIRFIYLTGIRDMNAYLSAKNSNPHRFLVKPIDKYNLHIAIMDIDFSKKTALPVLHLFIDKSGNQLKINPSTILYVKASRSYCDVHFQDHCITLGKSMKAFIEELDQPGMIKIGKSCTINMDHFKNMSGNQVEMSNGDSLRITDHSYFQEHVIKHR